VELVEIRDLDGPNIFLLEPAIKIEFMLNHEGSSSNLENSLVTHLKSLHNRHGQSIPAHVWTALETSGHFAFAYGWSHRRFALGTATFLAQIALNEEVNVDEVSGPIGDLLAAVEPDDLPLMVRDIDRTMPIVSITGTNGKTTTTRLIAHILRKSGQLVGWSSSSGVFIEGEQVIEGDYTGPAGALRVLKEPGLDAAVLETARGGILLRGIAYESNDVSVFTNVSADHLDLQGIRSVEGLAAAKSTVIQITKPDGVTVLNADDPLVVRCAHKTRAPVCYISQQSENPTIQGHITKGGLAVLADRGKFEYWRDSSSTTIAKIDEIPITFGGSARHMVENALCASAASLAMGLEPEAVRDGLKTFTSSPSDNLGRLNVYEVDGVIVIVDFAHNEAGLRHLLDLATGLKQGGQRLVTIIGTAGDRTDANLFEIGRIAAEASDAVIIKETRKYLRGRADNDELNQHYIAGIKAGGGSTWAIESSELAALDKSLKQTRAGDVIAMMCVEQVADVQECLQAIGRPSGLGQSTR
jgi:cyanophycin synthetase